MQGTGFNPWVRNHGSGNQIQVSCIYIKEYIVKSLLWERENTWRSAEGRKASEKQIKVGFQKHGRSWSKGCTPHKTHPPPFPLDFLSRKRSRANSLLGLIDDDTVNFTSPRIHSILQKFQREEVLFKPPVLLWVLSLRANFFESVSWKKKKKETSWLSGSCPSIAETFGSYLPYVLVFPLFGSKWYFWKIKKCIDTNSFFF